MRILDALFGELEGHLSAWFGRKKRSKVLIRKIRSELSIGFSKNEVAIADRLKKKTKPSTTPFSEKDSAHVLGKSHTPSTTPFPHDPQFDNFAKSTMTPGKRQPDEFITHPNIRYDEDQNMPVVGDNPMADLKEKLKSNKMQRYIDSDHIKQIQAMRDKAADPVRVKVAYDFDAADVRTHNKSYARRSFAKEARNSRYSSYSDQGTPV